MNAYGLRRLGFGAAALLLLALLAKEVAVVFIGVTVQVVRSAVGNYIHLVQVGTGLQVVGQAIISVFGNQPGPDQQRLPDQYAQSQSAQAFWTGVARDRLSYQTSKPCGLEPAGRRL